MNSICHGLLAFKLAFISSRTKLLHAWITTPLGTLVILAFCFGIDVLLQRIGLSFPASVAGLILLFLGLLLLETSIGTSRTERVVSALDIPMGWVLRWINLFFVPSFVTLPLNSSVDGIEVAKIIAVFVVGWVVMMIVGAYLTRGLQLLFGSHKKAHPHSDDSTGTELENIIPTVTTPSIINATEIPNPPRNVYSGLDRRHDLRPQTFHPEPPSDIAEPNAVNESITPINTLPQRVRHWAVKITSNLDVGVYGLLFVVGLPVYYVTECATPVQLSICVLSFQMAMRIPTKHRTYLHPILISATTSVLIAWALAATKGDSLQTGLRQFRTGVTYRSLLLHPQGQPFPGAGDILVAILDAGIVALALPMYRYRRELREHCFVIVIPCLALSVASLFAYPYICFSIGISAENSLALASRSLTVALAIPATENLGGDLSTVAAVAVMSGIIGALVGQRLLNYMRIPKDDYLTRGITLGANSAAIITALLLQTDPRAAAMASLSMSLFGTITVILTSVSPIATAVKSMVA